MSLFMAMAEQFIMKQKDKLKILTCEINRGEANRLVLVSCKSATALNTALREMAY